MKDLSSFLAKFKKIRSPKKDGEEVSKVLTEVCGIDVTPEMIKLSQGAVFVSVSGPLKSEIFLNKTKILGLLQKELPHLKIKDIR